MSQNNKRIKLTTNSKIKVSRKAVKYMKDINLEENSILIVPNILKNKILKKIRTKDLKNIKILTIEELRKKFYFDYTDKAVLFLMEKYNYQYDVAKMYLARLHEVGESDFGSPKIKKIIDLKTELKNEGLLIFQEGFRQFIKDKTLIIYDSSSLTKLDLKMIDELKKICKIEYLNTKPKNYTHQYIWEFGTIEEEVLYIASQIKKLVTTGISLNKIKIYNASGEYLTLIKRIFEWFHIPITFTDNYLYATKIGRDFLENLNETPEETLNYLSDKYPLTNPANAEAYNQLIQILNRYLWADSILKVKDFIISDLKNTPTSTSHFSEEVILINSLAGTTEDEYVFLVGFNQSEYPKTYKDESYFNDNLKEKLGLETTNELNQNQYNACLTEINQTKNLIITTKQNSSLGVHYLSSLNDDLKLEVKKGKIEYHDSHLYNQLTLGEKIDTFVKYNELSDNLELLYSNYEQLPYGTFNSDYSQIPAAKIKDYLNHRFVLSYSAMNTYYQCSFRYYLANILKLNIFEETFYTVLGNLFHYILSICFEKEIDLKQEYEKYLKNCSYPFNSREKFFLKQLIGDLEFIINTINKQNETNSLDKTYYEEKITVNKNREDMEITFKGFVDKLMTNNKEEIISIIDYKTGNPDLNLNHVIYGLDLQLPVYIYLAKKKFPNAKIAGFYLQKILNNEISKDYKHTYEYLKEDKLKLQGYSNSDTSILEKFDSSYYESKTIKGMRTTSKGIASKKILNDEKIDKLEKITEEKIDEAINGILDASFDINPKRIGMDNVGCKYCDFKDICFFTEKNMINLKEYKNMEFLGGEDNDTNETN